MPFFALQRNPTSGRWLLRDPKGKPFYSIGINHVDESNLLHPLNREIHSSRYPTRETFISKTVARLRSLGITTLGWTQEYVAGTGSDNLHSTGWSQHELRDCGMPYMVALPVMEIQDWNGHPVYRNPASDVFKMWCEYLARSICSVHKDSELCVGYFFVDIPSWTKHRSGADFPGLLESDEEERDSKINEVAEQYYATVCEAVRAVDPNHLIFGDRFNGNRRIPDGVLEAMKDYVDVLSVQYFCEPTQHSRLQMVEDLKHWSGKCGGKPVLLADIGNWCATEQNPQRKSVLQSHQERGEDYAACGKMLLEQPWCIGWHWCGYIENIGGRGWGIVDPYDEPYVDMTDRMTELHTMAEKLLENS